MQRKVIKINSKERENYDEQISREGSIKRLFETIEKLSRLNEIEPISEEEIQAEIEAYREEKRARNQAGV